MNGKDLAVSRSKQKDQVDVLTRPSSVAYRPSQFLASAEEIFIRHSPIDQTTKMSINNSNDTTNPPQPHGLQHAPTPSLQTLIHDLHNRLTTALQQPLLPISPHISAIISLLQHLCSNLPTPTSLPTPLYARACHAYAEQSLILLVRALRENFYGREMRMQPYRRISRISGPKTRAIRGLR